MGKDIDRPTVKKNTEHLLFARKQVALEADAEKTV
jgi:hypothetical protein